MQEPNASPDDDNATADENPGKRQRSYYYDDSHGYEDFDPENEDIENEEENCSE